MFEHFDEQQYDPQWTKINHYDTICNNSFGKNNWNINEQMEQTATTTSETVIFFISIILI